MLSSSSRYLRCYIAASAASDLRALTSLPNSAPIRRPNHNPTPFSTSVDPPLFSTATRFISCSRTSSSPEQEATLNQILSSVQNAATLLESLYENCLFLSPKSFNRVLVAAAAESSAPSSLSQLLQLAIASSQPLNSACFLTVAKALAKSDDCAELLKLTKQVMELTSPSMTVINRIIFAFGECGETEKALLIFSQMKILDFVPDLYTHNTVLEILGCAGRVDEMLGQFGSMRKAGIAPVVVSYNTVLNNLRKLGKFDVCLFYYKEMGENGVEADLLTYTAVIESLGRSGNVEGALRFFDEMKARQIRPSLYVYRSLITNLKKMGKVDLALSLTEDMNSCDSELAGPMDFKRNKRFFEMICIKHDSNSTVFFEQSCSYLQTDDTQSFC